MSVAEELLKFFPNLLHKFKDKLTLIYFCSGGQNCLLDFFPSLSTDVYFTHRFDFIS